MSDETFNKLFSLWGIGFIITAIYMGIMIPNWLEVIIILPLGQQLLIMSSIFIFWPAILWVL